ncbi:hypothetical protein QQF64_008138 [Cirrhinus molitorella]|uniref:Secreted protein n=1 Tax=Cirrhinus molitorella TaxID=172907 RepID=A0ABR3M7M5_9TELE
MRSAVLFSVFLADFSREKQHPSLCGLPGVKEHCDTCLVCFCIYGEELPSPSLAFNWESHLAGPGVSCRGLGESRRSAPSLH